MGTHTSEYHTLNKLIDKMNKRIIDRYHFNVGAIVLDKRGNIISYGENNYSKTHPWMVKFNTNKNRPRIYLHAEVDALIKCKNEKPYTLIVCRLGRSGEIRLAHPCPICTNVINYSKLHRVLFTNDEGNLELMRLEEDILV